MRGLHNGSWVLMVSLIGLCCTTLVDVHAEVVVPNIFGDNMVFQQGKENRVWGKAEAGEEVSVVIASQRHTTTADASGNWRVTLTPLPMGRQLDLQITGKLGDQHSSLQFHNVLVGEVWICSGQSNMQWSVDRGNDPDLERLAANFPEIRMVNFPQVGSQEPIWTHNRNWLVCNSRNVGSFSAVGYYFARQLHQTLGVPIGMINNAWGGSACEAWIDRDLIAADPSLQPLLERWGKMETDYAELKSRAELSDDESKRLAGLERNMRGNHRPANIYQGVLSSHIGYGIRGAIWYQGESNASRAYQYRKLFPLMISNWRKVFEQGDFPFYWVQLADFRAETAEPGESDWAELREAQTMTMSQLDRTGEAVIIDLGEGKDIHPKNKVDVGRRLARWALANEYGFDIPFHSPMYRSMERDGNRIVLHFDHVGSGWRPFDVANPVGFAIAGSDKKFAWANAEFGPENTIVVWSDEVEQPASVRYAWSDNPVCNVFNRDGLPLTPFRTDDWPGVTIDSH